jgi:arylsulfatase A-like enzyme
VTARNVVIISLDTVRRDHLPTYGYARDTAPAVDKLSRTGTVFENAFTQDTNTNPSHTSMFTGVYPHVHGNRANGVVLRSEEVTLGQILQREGFRTGAFITGVTLLARASGLDKGFDVYEDDFEGKRREGSIATDLALRWLGDLEADDRFFLFLHLFDAHGPYLPKPPYDALFRSSGPEKRLRQIPRYQAFVDATGQASGDLNGYVDRYDAGIRTADDCVATLLRQLDLDETLVVVIADHGETLGERAWQLDHGGAVFDEQTRIPLIAHVPGLGHARVQASVEAVDLLPTCMTLLGLELPVDRPVLGRDLTPLLDGEAFDERDLIFTSARPEEVRHADRGYKLDRSKRILSVRSSGWKLILYPGTQEDYVELYELTRDPMERRNVQDKHPEIRDGLLQTLASWVSNASSASGSPELDPELYETFKGLGYVGGDDESEEDQAGGD